MESLSLPMPPHSSNHTGSLNTTVISTIQIKQNAAISFTPTNVHRTREQTYSWQGSQKVTSFQVCFDNVKNVTISPPQNTHCKNVLKKKKKVQARTIQGSKKKSLAPLLLSCFTIVFCYKISNNNLKENHHTNSSSRI